MYNLWFHVVDRGKFSNATTNDYLWPVFYSDASYKIIIHVIVHVHSINLDSSCIITLCHGHDKTNQVPQ